MAKFFVSVYPRDGRPPIIYCFETREGGQNFMLDYWRHPTVAYAVLSDAKNNTLASVNNVKTDLEV